MPEIDAFFYWFVRCGTVPVRADRLKLYADAAWLRATFAEYQAMPEEERKARVRAWEGAIMVLDAIYL